MNRRDYMGTWESDDGTFGMGAFLYDLAKKYFTLCDDYDQRVCSATSPRTGEPIPATSEERHAINANARRVIEALMREGVSRTELQRAIGTYGRHARR